MLVTILGAVPDPGVHEVAIGTPIGEVLGRPAAAAPLQAILLGGYFGTWVRRRPRPRRSRPQASRPSAREPGAA